jgi:peptidoglycan/LPS O-acetylase OafA/YrhL
VGFYPCLPLIVWLMRRLGPNRVLAAGFVASVAWLYGCWWMSIDHGPAWGEVARQLPGQFCLFAVGMALRHNREAFARWRWHLMAAAFLLCLLRAPEALAPLTDPLVLGVLAIGFATGPYVGYRAPLGDLSYGVYLWHFPIIQLLVAWHAFDAQPWTLVAVAVVLALSAALLSWHLVERRFLVRGGAGGTRRVAAGPVLRREVVD